MKNIFFILILFPFLLLSQVIPDNIKKMTPVGYNFHNLISLDKDDYIGNVYITPDSKFLIVKSGYKPMIYYVYKKVGRRG